MKPPELPYIFTKDGREKVRSADNKVKKFPNAKTPDVLEASTILAKDFRQKMYLVLLAVVMAAVPTAFCLMPSTSAKRQKDGIVAAPEDRPLESADPELIDRSIIRFGIKATPQEKEQMKQSIRKALKLVLADPELAKIYSSSVVVEQLVVPDLLESMRELSNMFPDHFKNLNMEREASNHGDAYTVAIEDRGKQNELLAHRNYMLLREELLREENFARFVVTLDHEVRHFRYRGKGLSRREEEKKVYTEGIHGMKKMADALEKRKGPGDIKLAEDIRLVAIPIHEQRLHSWARPRE